MRRKYMVTFAILAILIMGSTMLHAVLFSVNVHCDANCNGFYKVWSGGNLIIWEDYSFSAGDNPLDPIEAPINSNFYVEATSTGPGPPTFRSDGGPLDWPGWNHFYLDFNVPEEPGDEEPGNN